MIVAAGGLIYLRHCEWNPELAAEYATENAEKKSVGMCALYVRKAINAEGVPLWSCGSEVIYWDGSYIAVEIRSDTITLREGWSR